MVSSNNDFVDGVSQTFKADLSKDNTDSKSKPINKVVYVGVEMSKIRFSDTFDLNQSNSKSNQRMCLR